MLVIYYVFYSPGSVYWSGVSRCSCFPSSCTRIYLYIISSNKMFITEVSKCDVESLANSDPQQLEQPFVENCLNQQEGEKSNHGSPAIQNFCIFNKTKLWWWHNWRTRWLCHAFWWSLRSNTQSSSSHKRASAHSLRSSDRCHGGRI